MTSLLTTATILSPTAACAGRLINTSAIPPTRTALTFFIMISSMVFRIVCARGFPRPGFHRRRPFREGSVDTDYGASFDPLKPAFVRLCLLYFPQIGDHLFLSLRRSE